MSARALSLLTLSVVLGGLLAGCGDDRPPPGVRVLQPDDGATLVGQRVTFRAQADVTDERPADAPTLRWSFGDGETATGPEVTHVYENPGRYSVSVVAVDAQDRAGEATELTIQVQNAPPRAEIEVVPTSGEAPLEVSFNAGGSADPDGSLAEFRWTLGDGTTRTGREIAHTYEQTGDYDVTLTVRDADGADASATTTIQVTGQRRDRPSGLTWEVRMVTAEDGRAYFDPAVLVVEPGDTIRWTTATGRHSSTAYAAGLPEGAEPWDTGVVGEPGQGVDVTLPEDAPTGSYPYYCKIHEDAGMLGLIVVGEPSELDPEFRASLPSLLRTKLDDLLQRADNRVEGGSP
jgi:plastocyanin